MKAPPMTSFGRSTQPTSWQASERNVSVTQATVDQQTQFEEQELDDEKLISLLDTWAELDSAIVTQKETAKPYTQAIDQAKDNADEALAAVSAHLKHELEIDLSEPTDDVYRAGVYRLLNRATDARDVAFERKAKSAMKIERAAS